MGTKKNETQVASVLAFEKKLVPSDGVMFGCKWNERHDSNAQTFLPLHEKSVRGTISNRLQKKLEADPLKLDAEVEKANLQTVDAVSLKMEQDTLKVQFTLKVLPGAAEASACNNEAYKCKIQEMGKKYSQTYGYKELAKRYALNIANARYLWRNRVGAEKLEVKVTAASLGKFWTFDPYAYSLKSFDQADAQVKDLAGLIAAALSGEKPYLLLDIEAFAFMGNGQEIYPSEELVLDKGRGRKSKILYEVDGTAALHSQKIGNALRTIDTWYPEYRSDSGIGPIAIEPYGAVTNLGRAYRTPKEKVDFYTLFDRYSQGEALANPEQEHYVMAVLIRGGVFGQSGKD